MFGFHKIFTNRILFTAAKNYGHSFIRRASQKSPQEQTFMILRATPKDFDQVVDLFRYTYFNGEPTMVAAGLAYKSIPIMENLILESLTQGMSLMARCRRTGNLMGAAVNVGTCPWDADLLDDYANTCTCPKVASVLKFYSYVTRKPNLWERFNEYKIFEISFLATDAGNQGKGVGRELIIKSKELAKDLTYTLVRLDATNFYTTKICERLNMIKIESIPFKSYVDCNGKPIFLPEPPHQSVDVFVEMPHAPPELRKKLPPNPK